jgi:branched-chain amino acid transport system ATP-binding protein
VLQITDLHYYYDKVHAVKGIDLGVNKGEIVVLIGANGAGKTTTLRCISGILRPSAGRILFLDKDLCNKPAHVVARAGITQVLEGRGIFGHLTVLENLQMGTYLRKDRTNFNRDLDHTFELFPRLKERISQQAGTLSGGEQQMLAVSTALMAKPKLLLLDEPSLGLAPVFVDTIFTVIRRIADEGTPILLVEQNAHLALEISDRGYVMELGKIVISDTGSALLKNDLVRKTYLGQS